MIDNQQKNDPVIDADDEITEVGPPEGQTVNPKQPSSSESHQSQLSEQSEREEEATQAPKIEQERDEFKDKYLRTYAELENFRKRASRDKEELMKFGNEKLLKEVLQIKDDLDRALEHKDDADPQAIKEGLILIGKDFDKLLQQFSVETIAAVGEPFDPNLHEALAEQESPTATPGTVLSVYQPGYRYHGRLIRPAKVVVVKQSGEQK